MQPEHLSRISGRAVFSIGIWSHRNGGPTTNGWFSQRYIPLCSEWVCGLNSIHIGMVFWRTVNMTLPLVTSLIFPFFFSLHRFPSMPIFCFPSRYQIFTVYLVCIRILILWAATIPRFEKLLFVSWDTAVEDSGAYFGPYKIFWNLIPLSKKRIT